MAEPGSIEPKRVVHEDDLEVYETEKGSFSSRRRLFGLSTGAQKLGCSLYELPPGRRSFPYHWHAANEEALYVLEGEGMLRLAGREVPIRKGCYATLPVGEAGAPTASSTTRSRPRPVRSACPPTTSRPS